MTADIMECTGNQITPAFYFLNSYYQQRIAMRYQLLFQTLFPSSKTD
jgi:hypothetical protein